MSFRFFENAVNSDVQQMPNEMYRDIEQDFINQRWDDTTSLYTIQEQDEIGSEKYHSIEAWIDSTVADTTRGLTDTRDFNKLIFKDITKTVARGLMYKYDNNYWIVHSYNYYSSVVPFCGVRRCNNRLKIINPKNGKLEIFPCCVDYDMSSPSMQTSRYINTPNNHAVVIVQGNDLTRELLKTNTRYILSGRPFKLLAYQNAVEYDEENQESTMLYLDLYLDEIHDGDDLVNDIADNGTYHYAVEINAKDMSLITGATGVLKADITLNGEEVNRDIEWSSSNKEVVTIDNNGNYNVVGTSGQSAVITASILGNSDEKSSIVISVVSEASIEPVVTLEPSFDKIRQFDKVDFMVQVEYNGNTYVDFDNLEISIHDNPYLDLIKNGDNSYSLLGYQISSTPITLTLNITNSTPAFEIAQTFDVIVVSMMG